MTTIVRKGQCLPKNVVCKINYDLFHLERIHKNKVYLYNTAQDENISLLWRFNCIAFVKICIGNQGIKKKKKVIKMARSFLDM